MSNSATRQAIAAALSTLEGITGHAARPDVMSEGDGWPQWAGMEWYGGRAYTQKWNVLVVTPTLDDVTADHFVDERGTAIIQALQPIFFVDKAEPAKITTDAGDIYAVLFSGRSE
jgi:hypothetical protein